MAAPVYNGSTFNESFSQARNDLGPGQTFIHNNKEFTTNRADDINISNNSAPLAHDAPATNLGLAGNVGPVTSDTKNDALTAVDTTVPAPVETMPSTQETSSVPTYTESSFNESFAKARNDLGPGKTFMYDNKTFSTDRNDDKKDTVIDSAATNKPIDTKPNVPDDIKNDSGQSSPPANVPPQPKPVVDANTNLNINHDSAIDMNKVNDLSLPPNGISKTGLELLEKHEGCKETAYYDTATHKNLTIGCGHKVLAGDNIKDGDKIGVEQVKKFLNDDLNTAVRDCQQIFGPEWNELDQPRKDVLVNMSFQLGGPSLTGFEKMISAIKEKDYNKAADEMLNSKWHKSDTPGRAKELSEKMRNGQ